MYNPNSIGDNTQLIHQIQSDEVGQRLDRYLASILKNISRTGIQQLINDEQVFVNEKRSKPGYALRLNDEVRILQAIPSSQQKDFAPQVISLDVVYEDSDLLVINKAAGMVVHPAPGHHEDTLVNALLARYPELKGIQHKVVKRYIALVEGNVALDQGSIDAPIGRDPRHRQQMAITAIESREARTHFRVVQRFARHTLLLLQLETGRTHQIRVHLKAIGHPVVGDSVYGSGNMRQGISLQRQFLHASQLHFIHPTTGETLNFEAPLPDDLKSVLTQESIL